MAYVLHADFDVNLDGDLPGTSCRLSKGEIYSKSGANTDFFRGFVHGVKLHHVWIHPYTQVWWKTYTWTVAQLQNDQQFLDGAQRTVHYCAHYKSSRGSGYAQLSNVSCLMAPAWTFHAPMDQRSYPLPLHAPSRSFLGCCTSLLCMDTQGP